MQRTLVPIIAGCVAVAALVSPVRLLWRLWLSLLAPRYQSLVRFLTQKIEQPSLHRH